MKKTNRPPTRIEQFIGAILSAFAVLAFGAVLVFILSQNPGDVLALAIFGVLFLASVFMLYRAVFTVRRSLSRKEQSVSAQVSLVMGVIIMVAAILWASGALEFFLFSSGLSAFASGLAGRERASH